MRRRTGFTLVELVVVVMILGILAAVAAPKLLGTSQTARENGLRQTLGVVRDAIERYEAENGNPPANPTALVPTHLRGSFPVCPVGNGDDTVGTSAVSPLVADGAAPESWLYNATTGEFIVNHADYDDF